MGLPEPSIALLLLGSCGPGKRGEDEMSLSGININKKQMNLLGGGSYQSTKAQGHLWQTQPRLAGARLSHGHLLL